LLSTTASQQRFLSILLLPRRWDAQLAADALFEYIVDFDLLRHSFQPAVHCVGVDQMVGALALKQAAMLAQVPQERQRYVALFILCTRLFDQIDGFHNVARAFFLRAALPVGAGDIRAEADDELLALLENEVVITAHFCLCAIWFLETRILI